MIQGSRRSLGAGPHVGRCSRESAGANSKKEEKSAFAESPVERLSAKNPSSPRALFSPKVIFIKFYLKIANKFKISPILNMSLDMLFIAYKKVVVRIQNEISPRDQTKLY
jgi:hypothetical protein